MVYMFQYDFVIISLVAHLHLTSSALLATTKWEHSCAEFLESIDILTTMKKVSLHLKNGAKLLSFLHLLLTHHTFYGCEPDKNRSPQNC